MKGKRTGMLPKLVSILLTFIQVIIVLYILLKFFSANDTPFVHLLNALAAPLLHPFEGIFHPVIFNAHTLDLSSVFALIVYSVIGFGLQKIFTLLKI
ncbi:MAG: YggT family protein [Sporolactobacillus sp.]